MVAFRSLAVHATDTGGRGRALTGWGVGAAWPRFSTCSTMMFGVLVGRGVTHSMVALSDDVH
jgi:hypothetical protein